MEEDLTTPLYMEGLCSVAATNGHDDYSLLCSSILITLQRVSGGLTTVLLGPAIVRSVGLNGPKPMTYGSSLMIHSHYNLMTPLLRKIASKNLYATFS